MAQVVLPKLALADCKLLQFVRIVDSEFLHDIASVSVNGGPSDIQCFGNSLRCEPVADQLKNLFL